MIHVEETGSTLYLVLLVVLQNQTLSLTRLRGLRTHYYCWRVYLAARRDPGFAARLVVNICTQIGVVLEVHLLILNDLLSRRAVPNNRQADCLLKFSLDKVLVIFSHSIFGVRDHPSFWFVLNLISVGTGCACWVAWGRFIVVDLLLVQEIGFENELGVVRTWKCRVASLNHCALALVIVEWLLTRIGLHTCL